MLKPLVTIKVNTRPYSMEKPGPFDAIPYANRVFSLLGPILGDMAAAPEEGVDRAALIRGALSLLGTPEASALMQEALGRCYTAQNEPLHNMAVFNSWFRQFPEDVYELAARAVIELVKDYLPACFGGAAKALLQQSAEFQNQTPYTIPSHAPGTPGNPLYVGHSA